MSRVSSAELTAWILGALDPERASELTEAVSVDPELARRVEALGRRAAESWRSGPPRWAIPLPGMHGPRSPPIHVAPTATLGRLAPGGRVKILLPGSAATESARVVVMYRGAGGWDVAAPASASEEIRFGALDPTPDGHRLLWVTAGPEPGAQRWSVCLTTEDLADWSAALEDRWTALRRELAAGRVQVAAFELNVRARR